MWSAHDDADVDAIQHKMVGRDVDKEYYREQKQKPFQSDAQPLVAFDAERRP